MKKIFFTALASIIILLSAFTIINATSWQIKDGYAVKFTGKDVDGVFNKMTGDIQFDENNLATSRFAAVIDVTSITTGNGMKNRHAKSDKWFDATKYPTINFTSAKFAKNAQGYAVEGTLEMHGVKKIITVPFTFVNNEFKGSFSVNRLDYNVGNMEGMSKKVSNEIKIDITVPVTKK